MIRDVAELRERGKVCRRVDELSVPVKQWRAGIRAAARREGLRIRTFLVDPTDPDTADSDTADPAAQLVYAVLTERTPDPQALLDAMDAIAAPLAQVLHHATRPPAAVMSIADHRSRRSAHPCTGVPPDKPLPGDSTDRARSHSPMRPTPALSDGLPVTNPMPQVDAASPMRRHRPRAAPAP